MRKLLKLFSIIATIIAIMIPISLTLVFAEETVVNAEVNSVENITSVVEIDTVESAIKTYYREVLSAIVLIAFILAFICLIIEKVSANKLKKVIEIDQVTGLMTGAKFAKDMEKALLLAEPNEYFVLSFDIDNFKSINQIYGYEKGTELLREVANSMRKYATSDTLLCHYHNDVFIVFGKTKNICDFSTSNYLFLQARCDDIMKNAGINATLHTSTGVYIIDDTSISPEIITDYLRKARAISKQKHGNTLTVFSKELQLKTEKEMRIYITMEQAIKDEEFYIVVQPQVELITGKLIGGEVLVRWKTADGKDFYPDEFIPLFEKNQFITTLDKYVFNASCLFVKNANVNLPSISVNVSGVTAQEDDFLESYLEILSRYELRPEQFEIELTESTLNDNFDKIKTVIGQAKSKGFRISVDDFGKGASSLVRIRELEVDVIKLDKEFISGQSDQEKGKVVIANAISLANNLGIIALAEGIETRENLDMLKELGCDLGQGYLFDRPISTQEFLERVIDDAKKTYPEAIKSNEKIKDYLTNFESLPYGVAVVKNDDFYTMIKANKALYKLMGHTKQSFLENHSNRFSEILLDDIRPIIEEKISCEVYTLDLEIRLRTANNNIVWIHDYIHYDKSQDLFFITFTDLTGKMLSSDIALSFEAYQAQKSSLLSLNDLTSDYVTVSDVKTDEVIFMNENSMKLYGIKSEADWVQKKYKELAYGKDFSKYDEYYDNLNEKSFASRAYYNDVLKKYLRVQNKIITVLGRKMRLDVLTDITEKMKAENEISLQNTLHNCIEHLYMASFLTDSSDTPFGKMLEELRQYYKADRAYYFEFSLEKNVANNLYEVVRDGVTSQIQELQEIPLDSFQTIRDELRDGAYVYFNVKNLEHSPATKSLIELFDNGGIRSILMSPIKDLSGAVIGFIGVDNPCDNIDNAELMSLLSKFVWIYIKSEDSKNHEKEAVRLENLSNDMLLEKCTKNFQNFDNADEKIIEILYMLRLHYGASAVVLLSVDEEIDKYSVTHESRDMNLLYRNSHSKNRPIGSIAKLVKLFKNEARYTMGYEEIQNLPKNEQKLLEEYGISNVIASPIYNKNGVLAGAISVSNPTLSNRSNVLINVIAKDIGDYLEKISFYQQSMVDALTGLLNKAATEQRISDLLKSSTSGVIFIIDLDNFKSVNDTLGHLTGDEVLADLSKKLKKTFRSTDVLGRIGGDEFMAFCPDAMSDELVFEKAEALLKSCNREYEKDGFTAFSSVSIGICRITEDMSSFNELYQNADKALYEAKRNGRNQFHVFLQEELATIK